MVTASAALREPPAAAGCASLPIGAGASLALDKPEIDAALVRRHDEWIDRGLAAQVTDPASRRAFAPYWFLIQVGGAGLIRLELLRAVARRAESAALAAR